MNRRIFTSFLGTLCFWKKNKPKRAWVYFSGTNVIKSEQVVSVVKHGVGDYTITFKV